MLPHAGSWLGDMYGAHHASHCCLQLQANRLFLEHWGTNAIAYPAFLQLFKELFDVAHVKVGEWGVGEQAQGRHIQAV